MYLHAFLDISDYAMFVRKVERFHTIEVSVANIILTTAEILDTLKDYASPYTRMMRMAMQTIALASLSRAGFFIKAAFHGGTSLMMFHGSDRFSEDLDFELKEPDPDFDLSRYFSRIRDDFGSFGIKTSITLRKKRNMTPVQTAETCTNTIEATVQLYGEALTRSFPKSKNTVVKFEVDTDPPEFASYEVKSREDPFHHAVTLCDLPTLFAGKTGAVLTRQWKNRVKGSLRFRVLHQKRSTLNIKHLGAILERAGLIDRAGNLAFEDVVQRLIARFNTLDYDSAREDVRYFIKDPGLVDCWCPEHFISLTKELRIFDEISIGPESRRKRVYRPLGPSTRKEE